jgi:FkbM family methyltransferase
MSLDRLKWIYRSFRYRYKLEPREVKLLLELLKPGDTAVDIGAHKGAYTYWMRKAVGKEGRVIAFEPQPDLAAALMKLLEAGSEQNAVVECLGLSETLGLKTLHVPGQGSSPSASFEQLGWQAAGSQCYEVPVTTLDAYFASEEQRPVINLIKCDAEGHELEVFHGAEQTLRNMKPVLLFECEARHGSVSRVLEVFRFLSSLGYHGYFFDHDGLKGIDQFKPEWHQAAPGGCYYVNNFFFTPLAFKRTAQR